jgi:orotate phosphoribosyltransferase
MKPARATRLCAALIARLRQAVPDLSIDAVVAPALGGIVLGYELARQLDVLSLFVEREGGRFALRRGFALERGSRVLLAEDVVTTRRRASAWRVMPRRGGGGGMPTTSGGGRTRRAAAVLSPTFRCTRRPAATDPRQPVSSRQPAARRTSRRTT